MPNYPLENIINKSKSSTTTNLKATANHKILFFKVFCFVHLIKLRIGN